MIDLNSAVSSLVGLKNVLLANSDLPAQPYVILILPWSRILFQ